MAFAASAASSTAGAIQVDPQGIQRMFDDATHPDSGGEMEYPVSTCEGLLTALRGR